MNTIAKKISVSLLALTIVLITSLPVHASPWAKKNGYWQKTGGKFVFGLKHSLFSWTSWWTESREPQYGTEWEGFNVGLGKTVVYTAAGLIQLGTFFIPLDFPNIGIGIHIPNKECPQRHADDYIPGKNLGSLKTAPPAIPPAEGEQALDTEVSTPVESENQ